MSNIIIKNDSEPSTPSIGRTKIWVDEFSKKLRTKDDQGTIFTYNGVTGERLDYMESGFLDPENTVVSYNSSTRRITLTGPVEAYFNSQKVDTLVDGWVSDPHPEGSGTFFLYYNTNGFIWSTSPWSFKDLLIAFVFRDTANFCLRECHGLMPWQSHQHGHLNEGTFFVSGADFADFTLNSTTATQRRPNISATSIQDEDLRTNLPILDDKLFSQLFLTGSNTANMVADNSDIIPLTGTTIRYNRFTGSEWVQTNFPNNNYGKIFILAIPVTSDVECQKMRYVFVQPQTVNASLAIIQALVPASVNLGHISSALAEFVYIGEIIVRQQGGNWILVEINKIVGNRRTQVTLQSGIFLATVTTDTTLTGEGTNSNPLSVVDNYFKKSDSIGPTYSITKFLALSQSEYDLILTKDPNTVYFII
jgi:hypothetical protein